MALSKITAKFQTTLAAEFLDTGTTFTLTSNTDGTGNAISGLYCMVIDEGTDYEEFILGTINVTTKVVSGLTRGLDYSDPTTAVAALYKDHYRGAIVKITNFSILDEIRSRIAGTTTTGTVTSSATPTIDTDTYTHYSITALASAITSMTTNLSGTPVNFQKLTIRILDNGTARAIAWGASFEAGSTALPTTTIQDKTLLVEFVYDSVDSKWACETSNSRA